MIVGALRISLRLFEGTSLKDKRRTVRRLVEGARQRFNVSAAEVEDQDLLRRATIGYSLVANDAVLIERVLANIQEYVEANGEGELYECQSDRFVL